MGNRNSLTGSSKFWPSSLEIMRELIGRGRAVWATGCPDIWLHMTLGGFPWAKLAFESVDSGEQIASQEGWPHPAHPGPEQNKRLRKGEATLSSWVWPGTLVLFCLGSQTAWNVNHPVPGFPGLWAQTAAAHLLASLPSLHYNKHIVINRQQMIVYYNNQVTCYRS